MNEGRNADRFRRNFRADAVWARAPMVYWELCSPRVLTLQYLPGKARRLGRRNHWGGAQSCPARGLGVGDIGAGVGHGAQ